MNYVLQFVDFIFRVNAMMVAKVGTRVDVSTWKNERMSVFGQVNFGWTSGFSSFTYPWTSNKI